MSGDPFSTLNPSDSGFLNSFLASNPSKPLPSRVGEQPPETIGPQQTVPGESSTDAESVFEADFHHGSDPSQMSSGEAVPSFANSSPGEDSATLSGLSDDSGLADDNGLTDEQLDQMLLATPLPEGLLARLYQRFAQSD